MSKYIIAVGGALDQVKAVLLSRGYRWNETHKPEPIKIGFVSVSVDAKVFAPISGDEAAVVAAVLNDRSILIRAEDAIATADVLFGPLKKIWEPTRGDVYVSPAGQAVYGFYSKSTNRFGNEFSCPSEAREAAAHMRTINRLRKYVIEHAPGYDYTGPGYTVGKRDTTGRWISIRIFSFPGLHITMPKEVSIELCRQLNDGTVIL